MKNYLPKLCQEKVEKIEQSYNVQQSGTKVNKVEQSWTKLTRVNIGEHSWKKLSYVGELSPRVVSRFTQ